MCSFNFEDDLNNIDMQNLKNNNTRTKMEIIYLLFQGKNEQKLKQIRKQCFRNYGFEGRSCIHLQYKVNFSLEFKEISLPCHQILILNIYI